MLTRQAKTARRSDELMSRFAEEVCDDAAARLGAAEQFVVQARANGLAWAQIAELVGTSERAARQRYAALSVLAGAWPGELADRFAGP